MDLNKLKLIKQLEELGEVTFVKKFASPLKELMKSDN